jgi:hypothetical protein
MGEQLELDFGETTSPLMVTAFDPILGTVQVPADLYGE